MAPNERIMLLLTMVLAQQQKSEFFFGIISMDDGHVVPEKGLIKQVKSRYLRGCRQPQTVVKLKKGRSATRKPI